MADPFGKNRVVLISATTLKTAAFLLLVGIALAFWFYTQNIFNHVREFQQTVVKTHVEIYSKIIDPSSTEDSDIIELFEPVVLKAPYPSVFTDSDLNPIEHLWHNVGIAPDDTTFESRKKLKKLAKKMDSVNKPIQLYVPGLKARKDTLVVYEMPYAATGPVLVTDQSSNYLYSRNISVNPDDIESMSNAIRMLDLFSPPLEFKRENEPTLVFHGLNPPGAWPIIIAKSGVEPIYWHDVVYSLRDTTAAGNPRMTENIRHMRRNGLAFRLITNNVPIEHERLFHYGDLPFLTLIGWLPVIELGVALILLAIAWMGILTIKNAEQRSIWVGMAKETAHQLGTPISSLNGWIELLDIDKSVEMVDQALPEMEYDTRRLSRVAARFSSIGSQPELKPIVISDVITEVLNYYRARLPRMGEHVEINGAYDNLGMIMGNTELLNWAFENLIKNALSAIETEEGLISVKGAMSKDFKSIVLDFRDTGKGIKPSDQRKIMRPGFTTKKRGWGLGLSLVKRIIEDYHNGRIYLLDSKVGEGTAFRVILPALEMNGD